MRFETGYDRKTLRVKVGFDVRFHAFTLSNTGLKNGSWVVHVITANGDQRDMLDQARVLFEAEARLGLDEWKRGGFNVTADCGRKFNGLLYQPRRAMWRWCQRCELAAGLIGEPEQPITGVWPEKKLADQAWRNARAGVWNIRKREGPGSVAMAMREFLLDGDGLEREMVPDYYGPQDQPFPPDSMFG